MNLTKEDLQIYDSSMGMTSEKQYSIEITRLSSDELKIIREKIRQNQKLRDLVERKIIELDTKGNELFNQGTQDYEIDILQSLLQSLLDDSTKNEEVLR